LNTEDIITNTEVKDLTQMSSTGHSDKANKIIDELNVNMHGQVRDKILELIDVLRNEDKLTDKQIVKVLLTEVKFTSRSNLYNYLPDYMKRKYEHKALPDKQEQEESNNVIEYVPKQTPKDIPTEIEQGYINSVQVQTSKQQPVMDTEPEVYYKISQEDKSLLNKAKYIQSEGFIFAQDPQIWKNDTGKGFAEEFNLPENRDKRFILLVQEDKTT
jgi:hypothetical protein